MAHYLVTGGAGFIGSHLCDELVKEHTVIVLDNLSSGSRDNLPSDVELVVGDVRDLDLVESLLARVSGCFHLAAVASVPLCNEDLLLAHHVNQTGTLNVLASAVNLAQRHQKVPIVFASTCAVYGDNQMPPSKESDFPTPKSVYATTKLCSEFYGRLVNELHQIPFTALRLFNVYGSRQKFDSHYAGVIQVFLRHLLHDEPCIVYGDGTQSRDFVYVNDAVRFMIQAMKTSNHAMRVFNVCTGHSTDVQTIADLLCELLNTSLEIEHQPPKIGDIHHARGNPELAKTVLGIETNVSIKQGLEEFINETVKGKACK